MAEGMWDSLSNVERIQDECRARFDNNALAQGCFIAHYLHLTPKDLAEFLQCVFN